MRQPGDLHRRPVVFINTPIEFKVADKLETSTCGSERSALDVKCKGDHHGVPQVEAEDDWNHYPIPSLKHIKKET